MPDVSSQPLSKNHLAALRKYQQKKFRKLEQRVLVEGWNLLEQLLDNGLKPLEIITTDDNVRMLQHCDCPVYLAQEHELKALSETETPQSIVALFAIPELKLKDYRAIIYLDGIQDPGNLGTIFRIASAFGFDGIVLSPLCCEVYSPKVIRASLGSVFWLPSLTGDIEWLQAQDARKVGLDARADFPLHKIQIPQGKPVILVIGSEGSGIRSEVLSLMDIKTCIPISNTMESLNASVAAGIAAYELSERLFLLT